MSIMDEVITPSGFTETIFEVLSTPHGVVKVENVLMTLKSGINVNYG